jgi:hypothetical protein
MRCSASKIATLFLREGASPEALYMGWLSHESTGEGAFTDIRRDVLQDNPKMSKSLTL